MRYYVITLETVVSSFALLPAIDLRAGRVVRLEQGDFARETRYRDDPVAVARGFAAAGARWLHVVDLDGARDGEPRHRATIRSIADAVGDRVSVEIAGGLRSHEAIAAAFASGAARIVLGTAALRDPSFAGHAVDTHGAARVAVAVDVRDGQAVGEGWRDGAPGREVGEAIEAFTRMGVSVFEVTAIDRDGLRGGPDLALIGGLLAEDRSVIASGGVSSVEDIVALRDLGCAGAILGRALYEGDVALGAALAALRD